VRSYPVIVGPGTKEVAMDVIDVALLSMRVVLGLTLAAHGYAKFFAGGRIAGTARWFDSIGMQPGRVHALLAAGGEILAGLAMAAGFLTTFAALGFVGLMVVAGYTVHRQKGFFIVKEGWEYVFVLGSMAVVVAMLGPGELSIDAVVGLDDDLDGYLGLALALIGGSVAAGGLLAAFFRPPPAAS
jgi:putative oxidoreductase